jgi:hypothetical protein
MAAQAWFSRGDVEVAPGTVVVLQLTVVNLADTTDSFVITPAGLAAAWTTITPSTITLFGGTQQDIEVRVAPPLLPGTGAGPTSLSVRIVPQSDPDEVRSVDTVLDITTVVDRRLDVLQPAQRGRYGAMFEMMLENRGNSQASCRLYLIDPTGRLEAEFDPPTAGVEPGVSTLVRAKVRATRMQWERRPRTIPFRIDAAETGCPTTTATATFVQSPVVPERVLGRLVGLGAALVLLALAWVAVVRPAVRDAARDAVAGVPAAPASTVVGQEPDDTDTSTPQVVLPAADDEGVIINIPLPVISSVGAAVSVDYEVPKGKRLRITDIVVQNPNGDQGVMLVLRDTETLYTFRLDNILGDTGVALVTPIELRAGQRLIVNVTCGGVGDPTVPNCTQNVFASGVLLKA